MSRLVVAILMLAAVALAPVRAANAAPEWFQIDPVHTRVLFFVEHARFARSIGWFRSVEGGLWFDPDDWTASRIELCLPVASLVRLGVAVNNLRYLHCSLCNTEWNVPRATCTACGSDKSLAQHQIEGGNGAMRAETCDDCKSYLKIAYQEKDPRIDPVADDLATLALDLLVDEAGYGRSGPNLLLVNAAG